MSVKQVFFRSLRVWIFAGALLVGETVCLLPKVSIDKWDEQVKRCSNIHVKALLGLTVLWDDVQGEAVTYSTNPTLLGTLSSMVSMNNRILESLKEFHCLSQLENLDKIYKSDQYGNVLDCVPPPYGPNVMKVTRVKVFAKYLNQEKSGAGSGVWKEAVHNLVSASKLQFAAPLRTPVSELMQLLAHLPYIDGDGRFALLPLNHEAVLWGEVKNTHNKMKDLLSCYVIGASDRLERDKYNSELVYNQFVKRESDCSNEPMINHLNFLYQNYRFYRLAASEEYYVYVDKYPSALKFATNLKTTIRILNRFALVVSREEGYRKDELGRPSIVMNLDRTLKRRQPELPEVVDGHNTNFDPGYALKFGSELIESVEQKLKIYRTYKKLSQSQLLGLILGRNLPHNKKQELYSHLRFVVAFLDQKSHHLKTDMLDTGVARICSSQPFNWPKMPEFECWTRRIAQICRVRKNLTLGSGAEFNVNTFYSHFRKLISPEMLAHLEGIDGPILVGTVQSEPAKARLNNLLGQKLKRLFEAQFELKHMWDGLWDENWMG